MLLQDDPANPPIVTCQSSSRAPGEPDSTNENADEMTVSYQAPESGAATGPLLGILRKLAAICLPVERSPAGIRKHEAILISQLGHGLRSPLAAIQSSTQYLRDNPNLPDEQRQRFLDLIVTENSRLITLVDKLLDSAQSPKGGTEPQIDKAAVAAALKPKVERKSSI